MPAPPRTTFYDLVTAVADAAAERPAVLAANESRTYGQLRDKALRLAVGLHDCGVGPASRVGLLCNNRAEWIEALVAVSRLGATLVPISTWSTPAELEFILGDCRVDALITLDGFGGQQWRDGLLASEITARHLKTIVLLEGEPPAGWQRYADLAHSAPRPLSATPAPDARKPFVILYTSGSSARPKAVPLVEPVILENGFNIGERQGLGETDRVLASIPLFWSYGAANALPATLTHGATIVLQSRFEPGGALDLIERHKCTSIYTLPAMTSALLAHAAFRPERTQSLRTGVTIGSPQDVIKAAGELGIREICNIYGSTETYGNCCVTPHDWPLERRAACQGPPLPGVTLRIRDGETGALLSTSEIGQIEVKGHLTPGYLFDSARHNGEVFTPDGWFRTGDLGRLNPDGTLVYAGRSSEMIKRSGINVSPAEVEEVLQQHPDVGLAGVTGAPDPIKGEVIMAYVIPRPGSTIAQGSLVAFCRERLSAYKLPDHVIAATELPLTPTGKLMRRELKAMAARDIAGKDQPT
jgi:fatty-acyl-CoA synthase